MIERIAAQLRSDEGFVPHVYQDHLGFDTIGYGFLVDERRGGGIPKAIAEIWLYHEIDQRTDQLRARWPKFEDQPEDVQVALANMAYQLGVSGVLNFRKMLAALERGDRQKAAIEALDSRWANQTPERARRVAGLIIGDQ